MSDTLPLSPLPDLMIEPIVRASLVEDLGRAGDITSDAIIPPWIIGQFRFVARTAGTLAGLQTTRLAFALIDPTISFTPHCSDGDRLSAGTIIADVSGPARTILTAERTALNLVCRLSGIASATADLVAAVVPHPTRIVCTRKTTPGLRTLEKYAVRAGGGMNHRFGLDDAILIKDNHIAVAGGIEPAVTRARAAAGHLVKIEVEIDRLDQLHEALALKVDCVLLDNMPLDMLRAAVSLCAGRAITEASGGVTPETVGAIAATGVDLISSGWITHSAPILDIGLDAVG